MGPHVLALVAMGVVLAVVAAIRLRLLEFPLERDEGEFAYMGRLLLQGVAPYGEAASMKWPGTYLAYAAIMALFGETTSGIHAGLLLVTLGSSALLFVLARRIAGSVGGATAAAAHAVLAIGVPTLGLAAHATHFVVLFALGGMVLLTAGGRIGWGRTLAAGGLFGLAALMKQAGAAFGLFAVGWLVWRGVFQVEGKRDWRGLAVQMGALGAGGLLPLLATALWLWWAGVWPQFWLWTVLYAKSYATLVTPAEGLPMLGSELGSLWAAAPGWWAAAAVGLVVLLGRRELRRWRVFVVGFAVLSFAAVCPGWYFRAHYFLLFLPAVALLAGIAVGALAEAGVRRFPPWLGAAVPAGLLLAATAPSLWVGRAVFFQLAPAQACRVVYGLNPFPESVEVGRYLREHTGPGARIAVVGSEPQIYFYAQRRAATPYLYTYPLMELQPYAERMQREFIQGMEAADPDYLVYVSAPTSWGRREGSRTDVFEWFTRYQSRRFQLVGLVDIQSSERTAYYWADQPGEVRPQSSVWLAVLRNNRLAVP
jgi:hypothetical protein